MSLEIAQMPEFPEPIVKFDVDADGALIVFCLTRVFHFRTYEELVLFSRQQQLVKAAKVMWS